MTEHGLSLPSASRRESGPADTRVQPSRPRFWPAEMEEKEFVLVWATQFAVTSFSSSKYTGSSTRECELGLLFEICTSSLSGTLHFPVFFWNTEGHRIWLLACRESPENAGAGFSPSERVSVSNTARKREIEELPPANHSKATFCFGVWTFRTSLYLVLRTW